MSSMSRCTSGVRISLFSIGRAFARSTGCPMRATFRIDIPARIILTRVDTHPHDETGAYPFCLRCGGALERRRLKPSEPERPVCARCGFVLYIDPKIAVGTIIATADDRIVLVRRAIEPG